MSPRVVTVDPDLHTQPVPIPEKDRRMTPPRKTPRAGAKYDPTRDPVNELRGAVNKLAKLEAQREQALEQRDLAIRALADDPDAGMTVRGIAEVAGLSHQRVQQIIDPEGYAAALERRQAPGKPTRKPATSRAGK